MTRATLRTEYHATVPLNYLYVVVARSGHA